MQRHRHNKSGDTSSFEPTPVYDTASTLWAKVKVDVSTNCWEWTGSKTRWGYGQIRANKKVYATHRLAYELARGPIPQGMFVCHRCDNPGCINPDHLFIGTAADNTADMMAKGRHARVRGGEHSSSKLTEADVRAIRAATNVSQRRLAEQYGVGSTTIHAILRRKTWSHLSENKQ
jgi:hypothetical protein